VNALRQLRPAAALLAALLVATTCLPARAGNPAYVPNVVMTPHHTHHAYRADRLARWNAAQRPWHGPYAYTPYGVPLALVVPPNAKMHTSWSWGVAQSEMVPIWHQFYRDYPGEMAGGGAPGFQPTPYWPSHTDQFGVYPVRGPW
jgi:hypothetical protein